jgi:FMN phosphatase YigB (HAD superfamily)
MPNIKFIYFDVGGVLIFDYSGTNKWQEMKRDLGVSAEQDAIFEQIWQKHHSRICIDDDVDQIIPEFKRAGINIPANYSMLADFIARFTANVELHKIAQQIATTHQVGLLTNMYPRMLALIKKQQLIPDINWRAEIDSSIVGHQKPEPAIFELAEQASQIPPAQILFIDNSIENLNAAQQRGWQTLLYDPQNPKDSNLEIKGRLKL